MAILTTRLNRSTEAPKADGKVEMYFSKRSGWLANSRHGRFLSFYLMNLQSDGEEVDAKLVAQSLIDQICGDTDLNIKSVRFKLNSIASEQLALLKSKDWESVEIKFSDEHLSPQQEMHEDLAGDLVLEVSILKFEIIAHDSIYVSKRECFDPNSIRSIISEAKKSSNGYITPQEFGKTASGKKRDKQKAKHKALKAERDAAATQETEQPTVSVSPADFKRSLNAEVATTASPKPVSFIDADED